MIIFNSLGSNYDFKFVLRAIFVRDREEYRVRLVEYLRERYEGEVFLTYKGRESLRLALRMIVLGEGLGGRATVAICGFTCYAVYEACVKEGYDVEYLDIEKDTLNFSVESLKERCEKNADIGVVIVQNTLGIPCEIEKISDFCKKKGMVLIEDLAHSIGAVYEKGCEAGTVGDFTVLSFSQDKMVDGVAGGALVARRQETRMELDSRLRGNDKNVSFARVPLGQQVRDRFYPLFTWVIRKTYGVGLGKIIHAVLRMFDLLSKSMGGAKGDVIYGLPNWYCELIYLQFLRLRDDLAHRRRIAGVYMNVETRLIASLPILRFPIFVKNRDGVIEDLKKRGVFVSDIWYDSPIAPKRFLKMTDYSHECPRSEEISEVILNLPTHRNVREEDARRIAEYVRNKD